MRKSIESIHSSFRIKTQWLFKASLQSNRSMMNSTKLLRLRFLKMLLNIPKFIDKHQSILKIFILIDQSFSTKTMTTLRELRLKKIVNDMKNGIKINSKQWRKSLPLQLMMMQMETTNELWRRFWKKDSKLFLELLMNKSSNKQSIPSFKKWTMLYRLWNRYILNRIKIQWRVAISLEAIKMS